jgi:hypothetical protein
MNWLIPEAFLTGLNGIQPAVPPKHLLIHNWSRVFRHLYYIMAPVGKARTIEAFVNGKDGYANWKTDAVPAGRTRLLATSCASCWMKT